MVLDQAGQHGVRGVQLVAGKACGQLRSGWRAFGQRDGSQYLPASTGQTVTGRKVILPVQQSAVQLKYRQNQVVNKCA